MRSVLPEKFRIKKGKLATEDIDGANGTFIMPRPNQRVNGQYIFVMISDGMGWDHLSASLRLFRDGQMRQLEVTPTWDDMCYLKSMFFEDDECVLQFHPPVSMYVNQHPHCLHLWQCTQEGVITPMPHPLMVGVSGFSLGEKGKEMLEQSHMEILKLKQEKEAKAV